MSFSDFLNETVKKYIEPTDNEDKIVDIIKMHCKNYDFKNPIWRGMTDHGKYAFVEGQNGGRKSVDTKNYYTRIIDDNLKKQNSDYPLRSKSIICSTNYNTAINYGDAYMIIPYDNVMIGQCESKDIWHTKITINGHTLTISKWNNVWNNAKISDNINSGNDLAEQIVNIINMSKKEEHHIKISDIFDNKPGIVKDMIRQAYSLSSLNFTFGTTKTLKMGNDNELWLGGKCIAIQYEHVENICKLLDK